MEKYSFSIMSRIFFSWIFCISVVNLLEQQVAVTLPFLALSMWSKDCQEPNWSSCSLKAVSHDMFEKEAALQSSEEHQTQSALTRHGGDLLIKGVAE